MTQRTREEGGARYLTINVLKPQTTCGSPRYKKYFLQPQTTRGCGCKESHICVEGKPQRSQRVIEKCYHLIYHQFLQ